LKRLCFELLLLYDLLIINNDVRYVHNRCIDAVARNVQRLRNTTTKCHIVPVKNLLKRTYIQHALHHSSFLIICIHILVLIQNLFVVTGKCLDKNNLYVKNAPIGILLLLS